MTVCFLTISFSGNAFGETDWVPYSPAEGRFEILFPNTPQTSSVDRQEYKAFSAMGSDENNEYKVVYSVHREGFSTKEQADFLTSAKSMFVKSQKGKVKKEKDISVAGVTAHEVFFVTPDKKQVMNRIFFKDKTFFSLTVLSVGKRIDKKAALQFLDSFEGKPLIQAVEPTAGDDQKNKP